MLSVLIPSYNYSTIDLVTEIHDQCEKTGISFEIIVCDDASSDENSIINNKEINNLDNAIFEENKLNIGRAANRNLLTKKAKYDWLLFMDCDTFPREKSFIKKYIDEIKNTSNLIFYGGICYKETIPNKKEILRWKFGKKREEINLYTRNKSPYKTTLTSNIVIKKSVFEKVSFNESIVDYGYEDLVFMSDIKKLKINVKHIENSAYHLNYETSELFLIKTEKSLQNLKNIYNNNLIDSSESKIIGKWILLKRLYLQKAYVFLFKSTSSLAKRNLLSKNPSLFIFDLYKLGYFCLINSK